MTLSGFGQTKNKLSIDLLDLAMHRRNAQEHFNNNYTFRLNYEYFYKDQLTFVFSGGINQYSGGSLGIYGDLLSRETLRKTYFQGQTRKYFTSSNRVFFGGFIDLSQLKRTDEETRNENLIVANIEKGSYVGLGGMLGYSYEYKRLVIEAELGIGVGSPLSGDFYTDGWFSAVSNAMIMYAPSFMNINLGYRF